MPKADQAPGERLRLLGCGYFACGRAEMADASVVGSAAEDMYIRAGLNRR